MTLLPLIILALIQGLTEFLPVSSSGHLVLVHHIFSDTKNWQNHMVLDVAVHIGTLLSVLLYFRQDVLKMLCGLKDLGTGNFQSDGSKLNLYLILGSLPVIATGLILHITQPGWILMLNVVASTTVLFGILLWIADKRPEKSKSLQDMTAKDSLLIGLAQSLALIPGTSRSGITMTASRFLGYSRTESARFSLLLAIIAITGAGVLGGSKLVQSGDMQLGLDALLSVAISFIAGWISIAVMMRWLEKCSFVPFAIYRIILGTALLVIFNWEWLYNIFL